MADGAIPRQGASRSSHNGRGLQILTIALLLGSCNSAPDNLMVIHLDNLPDQTQSLEVNATLAGKAALRPMAIMDPLDSFYVQLSEEASGHLALDIEAFDKDGCSKGAGATAYELPMPATETTVSLTPLSPRKCGALPACAANTVCTLNKLQNSSIQAFWAITPTDIWAVGNSATFMHYDGTSWTIVPVSAASGFDANDVWGSATNDVWAVGQAGLLVHYDGSKWNSVTSPTGQTLFSIWGLGPKDIYAAGDSLTVSTQGAVLHYNGSAWTAITDAGIGTGRLNGIWADNTGSTLVYVCGVSGLLARYNGSTWDPIASNTTSNLHGIWGTSDHTVFAVGDNGKILRVRYSEGAAAAWNSISNVPTVVTLWAIRGDSSSNVVYALGSNGAVLRADAPYDTFTAQTTTTGASLFAITPASNGLVWLGGLAGFLGFLDLRP